MRARSGFREKLTKAGAIKPLFARLDDALHAAGFIAMGGQIVDASLVSAPKQRNSDGEKQALKQGRIPQDWQAKPAKLRQKDRDARWKVKFSKARTRADGTRAAVDIAIPVFGYQNHVAVDRRHGLIRQGLLDGKNTAATVWADTAYRSQANEAFLAAHGFVSRIHCKKPPGRAMPEALRRANALNAAVRARVEHVFAVQKDKMGLFVRTIGIARATLKIGMANLVYNIRRLVYLTRAAAT
jgi:hypothetical protein